MADLNKLSPEALKGAMTTGTDGWGRWGSATEHKLYVEKMSAPSRRVCRCGCRKRETHMAAANGVALSNGCEMSMRRFAKRLTRTDS